MGLRRFLAGEDGPGKRALPAGEFLHPAPLLALAVLALNDHVLKGSGALPGWLTGKLSDFAGLFFFPLLLTAIGDALAQGAARLTGARLDFSLRRGKLLAAIAVTAAVFVPLELSDTWARLYVHTLGRIGFPSQTTRDPTDLVALVMLIPAYLMGRAEIARVPLGRLEVIERDPSRIAERLADVRALARQPATVDELAARLSEWLAAPSAAGSAAVLAVLRRLRA